MNLDDLILLKRYLQNELDTGSHKMFIFDKDYNAIEFKICNALSGIEFIEKELNEYKSIIRKVIDFVYYNLKFIDDNNLKQGCDIKSEILEPLKDILEENKDTNNAYLEEFKDYMSLKKQLDQYKNNWEELKKWLNEYVETNAKWYNNDLSHHDKKYFEQIYSNTDFMLRKVLIQMKELEEDK